MMPNSPSETIIAAMFPLRNDAIPEQAERDHGALADPLAVQPPHDEEREGDHAMANAKGIGEMSSVQKSPAARRSATSRRCGPR